MDHGFIPKSFPISLKKADTNPGKPLSGAFGGIPGPAVVPAACCLVISSSVLFTCSSPA